MNLFGLMHVVYLRVPVLLYLNCHNFVNGILPLFNMHFGRNGGLLHFGKTNISFRILSLFFFFFLWGEEGGWGSHCIILVILQTK